MAQILVRNLEPDLVHRLKTRARHNNRSLQAEVKTILERAVPSVDDRRAAAWEAMTAFREETQRRYGLQPDSADLIRGDRERR
jgi:plasmid stability protein